ncbi:hypothetical protein SAMN04487787_104169 [Kosakonia sacchari]|nr:hypothetical protein SAMN04487787_104169 [Kosakonia sacchari]
MISEKKNLIISLMKKDIDFSRFLNEFNETYDELEICNELILAREAKDGEFVDLLLYLAAVVSYEFKCIDVLNDLITDDWHEKHEELVRLLGFYKSTSSVNSLYYAALLNLSYRDYDEDFVLADKCIRALAKINNKDAIEKLKLLSAANNDAISNSAKKQLGKLGVIN